MIKESGFNFPIVNFPFICNNIQEEYIYLSWYFIPERVVAIMGIMRMPDNILHMYHQWDACVVVVLYYGSWIYNYLCNQSLSLLMLWVWITFRRGVLDTILCDKVCQWLVAGRWFSAVSATIKTDCHHLDEVLLKVSLNTINTPMLPRLMHG